VTSAPALLRRALSGVVGERPLVGPRASAIAGEIEGLSPFEVLSDPGKLANLLAQLQRGSGLDVAWAESGSRLELEAAGARLDWSAFPPAAVGGGAAEVVERRRLDCALEATRRLRATLGDAAVVGWWLGPADPGLLLGLVRECAQAGAELIVLEQAGPAPDDPAGFARGLRPVVSTARFFQALPVVFVPELSAGWDACLEGVTGPGKAVAGVPVEHAADWGARGQPFAVGVDPGDVVAPGPCALVTTREELTGRMPLAEARPFLERLLSR
jgi:hypothetical protein